MTEAILVDTHIYLWARTAPDKLTAREHRVINAAQHRFVSIVAVWEIAILMGLGRVGSDSDFLDVPEGSELLPVRPKHCKALLELPRLHRDPFDRMLLAQARSEQVPLLTRDRAMMAYHEHAPIFGEA